ncbi:Nif3-like dinuclear metal center hexameric protein [Methanoregula sp.]|uniref:Nif3-like dinuclear metal center hexameric protein n=1 Tax=Methanoregula sp. TaxID=2052170 RepID=UPI00262510B7|nr:Nif3-like dinuclear metal center hexameric protein [Methanoregula sp.]MDD5143606.1 Nif3-like dinuclear metal center hexameric protein [Methanoregula sp.]
MDLSLAGDRVGFIGPGDADGLAVRHILISLDYPLEKDLGGTDLGEYDLLILHHPPVCEPEIPTYVIHSNWDVLKGGACDALADCLDIAVDGVMDPATGIGRTGTIRGGPVPLPRFTWEVMGRLRTDDIRIVNYRHDCRIGTVGLVSGFGLNPDLIALAKECGVDLFLSGDLTHKGAVLAQNLGIVLLDATHQATELPGLVRLAEVISRAGRVTVRLAESSRPWRSAALKHNF